MGFFTKYRRKRFLERNLQEMQDWVLMSKLQNKLQRYALESDCNSSRFAKDENQAQRTYLDNLEYVLRETRGKKYS